MSADPEKPPEEGLRRAERRAVEEHLKLRAPAIYEVLRREGVGELQLFTGYTITVVLPLPARPGVRRFIQAARLWLIAYGLIRRDL